jgi:hypothetical protein
MSNQFNGGDPLTMELKRPYITSADIETKPVPGTKKLAESFFKEGSEQKKNIPVKKPTASPAPFYDELHFANYE